MKDDLKCKEYEYRLNLKNWEDKHKALKEKKASQSNLLAEKEKARQSNLNTQFDSATVSFFRDLAKRDYYGMSERF